MSVTSRQKKKGMCWDSSPNHWVATKVCISSGARRRRKKKRGLGYLITFSSSLTLLSEDWKDRFQMILVR
jgi:hypothetical protein